PSRASSRLRNSASHAARNARYTASASRRGTKPMSCHARCSSLTSAIALPQPPSPGAPSAIACARAISACLLARFCASSSWPAFLPRRLELAQPVAEIRRRRRLRHLLRGLDQRLGLRHVGEPRPVLGLAQLAGLDHQLAARGGVPIRQRHALVGGDLADLLER